MTIPTDYYGRLFTHDQLTEREREQACSFPSQNEQGRCFRCNSHFELDAVLPNGIAYCRGCIMLGRIRADQKVYAFSSHMFEKRDFLVWQGQLTPWQSTISTALCQQVTKKQSTLVHAVTGAGKTEMVYAAIASILKKGGSVCLASPRMDVCLELYSRLQQDFSCPISLLHGESENYFATPLVIATTHQLLKFYQAFDLILIDEVDAFPYVDNEMLYHAVKQARKPKGVLIFLTATSTKALNRQVASGELVKLCLPRRFHGNPLVIPKLVWDAKFHIALSKQRLSKTLIKTIKQQRKTGFPLLLFIPEIKQGQELTKVLQAVFPNEVIDFVSSQTNDRLEIVRRFREKKISLLVTTTILERGVTFPCIDVFVLEAHHRLYSSSSLIQISGRVGRSLERPTGQLLFFHAGKTQAMKEAICEIKQMNQEARYDELSTL